MKHILIAGSSRAGKTTLARRLNEELGCFIISLDKLVATFAGAYPQLDIRLAWNREKTTENLAPFLGHFLGMFSSNSGTVNALNLPAHIIEGNRFVLEGAYFDFARISSILKQYGIGDMKGHFHLIGLVQNEKTPDAFFNDFRNYDTPSDWTYHLNDADLKEVSEEAVAFSCDMTDHLTQYGFKIYDTSKERAWVLERIVKEIKAEH